MTEFNPLLDNEMLPVEVVLHPSWWFHREGISFDEDFFYHPSKRVEAERNMEQALHQRWGKYGLGQEKDSSLPVIGPVHLAAGYLLSEMLGCKVEYNEDSPPQVLTANKDDLYLDPDRAFQSQAFRRFEQLTEKLKEKYGYITGDVNWSGILNLALDLRGQNALMDLIEKPKETKEFLGNIYEVVDRFVSGVYAETGTSSLSVNRIVRHFSQPVFLHSECSNTMISTDVYERFFMDWDLAWSNKNSPFGIHYCGADPHRYAEVFPKIPGLDFLDVGWGGDLKILRKNLPNTFLNIRLSPVEIVNWSVDDVKETVGNLVRDSENLWLTGVCCINMDHQVDDEKITAIFESVEELRTDYRQMAEYQR